MRLTVSLPDLERGSCVQTGPTDRILDLSLLADNKQPVAIHPVLNHDHKTISAILLQEGEIHGKTSIEIKFRPIWSKVFTLCSSTKDKLLALIIETEHGQYWIDREGHRKCNLTLNGNGTDPRIVDRSQTVLGELLAEDRRSDIIFNAIDFLKQSV